MITSIINLGVNETLSKQLARQVKLTNILLITLSALGLLLLFPIIYDNGLIISAYLDLFSVTLFSTMIWFNYLGYYNISRLVASMYPPSITILASIVVKIRYPESVVIFDFFDGRVLAGGFFILPFLLFSSKEKTLMFVALATTTLAVVAFDPIHNLFGVGYTNFFGAMPKGYIVSSIYIDVVMFFAIGLVYYFKDGIEMLLRKNALLANDLGEKNLELSALFEELEETNSALKRDEVLISNQKKLLEKTNVKLTEQVELKTSELRLSNEELVRHNNELQQFSNTLSHNLRGPVANLLGLSKLFKLDKSEESRDKVANHILKSAEALDGIIKDLNKVVELRNNLFQIKEKIEIKDEIESIWQILDPSVSQSKAKLLLNINTPVIYGVRSYFHSILYNLISNAIKYRNMNRDCLIRINSSMTKRECIIEVQDNGIGIDLYKHEDKMFGMYKRFHDHLEGKGLGLFLTKQQVEAMKGSISVESELGIGTRFTIKLPSIPLSQIQSQLFYKSKVADIYLDAVNNITTLMWKKMPTPFEFKEVFMNNIEVFSAYHSDKWIVDLKLMVNRSQLEKQWILDEAIGEYINEGIKKVAVIRSRAKEDEEFWKEFSSIAQSKSTEVIFASNTEQAKEILLNL